MSDHKNRAEIHVFLRRELSRTITRVIRREIGLVEKLGRDVPKREEFKSDIEFCKALTFRANSITAQLNAVTKMIAQVVEDDAALAEISGEAKATAAKQRELRKESAALSERIKSSRGGS